MTSASLSTSSKVVPSCPCCVFLKQDLFLPPSTTTASRTIDENKTKNSNNNKDTIEQVAGDEDKDDTETEVMKPIIALKHIQEYAKKQQQQQNDEKNNKKTKLPMLLVDTHNHAHLKQERYSIYKMNQDDVTHDDKEEEKALLTSINLVSVTLAVEPKDWNDAIQYSAGYFINDDEYEHRRREEVIGEKNNDDTANITTEKQQKQQDWTIMGLGIHPWYIPHDIEIEGEEDDEGIKNSTTNIDDDNSNNSNKWKQELEQLLQQHTSAIIGEIGLCKLAKTARSHPKGKEYGYQLQRYIFQQQIQLAIQYQRPISIHCVQQHGILLEILQNIITQNVNNDNNNNNNNNNTYNTDWSLVPPAMAMHSFTGTAHHVKLLLQWEAKLFGEDDNNTSSNNKKQKKKKNRSSCQNNKDETSFTTTSTTQYSIPPVRKPLIYFGFSHLINYDMCSSEKSKRQGRDAVCAVPINRLLAESDVHHPYDVSAGTAGSIAYLAWCTNMPIETMANITAQNGLQFLQSHL